MVFANQHKRLLACVGCLLFVALLVISLLPIDSHATAVNGGSTYLPYYDVQISAVNVQEGGIADFLTFKLPQYWEGDVPIRIYDFEGNAIGQCIPSFLDGYIYYNFFIYDGFDRLELESLSAFPLPVGDSDDRVLFGFQSPIASAITGNSAFMQLNYSQNGAVMNVEWNNVPYRFSVELTANMSWYCGYPTSIDVGSPGICRSFGCDIYFNQTDVQEFTLIVPGVTFNGYPTMWSRDLSAYERSFSLSYSDFPVNWVDWLSVSVEGFLGTEIAPGLSFRTILFAIIGISIFLLILKMFGGAG